MKMTKNGERFQAVVWGVLLLAGAAASPGAARSGEPQPACPKCSAVERGVPVLDKIPFVSRLFKNVGPIQDRKCSPPQELERIGIDFDVEACRDCPAECVFGSVAGVCQQNAHPQILVMRRTFHGKLASPCCEEDRCEEGCGEDCEEASACCRTTNESAKHGLSWERIVELTANNAALEASLEAQSAFHEEKSELTDSFVEILMENARLQTQVETQAKQAELTKELLTLVSENARLKAQVEMAEVKLTLAQEATRLAVENEQLRHALQVATSRKAQPYMPDSEAEVQTSNRVPAPPQPR
jgi:hypothetical protein